MQPPGHLAGYQAAKAPKRPHHPNTCLTPNNNKKCPGYNQ